MFSPERSVETGLPKLDRLLAEDLVLSRTELFLEIQLRGIKTRRAQLHTGITILKEQEERLNHGAINRAESEGMVDRSFKK